MLHPRRSPALTHITTSLDMGGAQTMLAKLIEEGAGQKRHPRHSVLSLMPPGIMADRLHACQCPVYDLGMARGWPTPIACLRLLRTVGALSPDILQGWMYHGNLAATVAGAFAGVPVVWNVRHSLNAIARESRITRLLIAWSARLSRSTQGIIYNSHAAAAEHERMGFAPERTIVIPNGFDCSRFAPDRSRRTDVRSLFAIDAEPLVLAMVARLHPMKDHAMLVDAVGRARQLGKDIHLLLVGTGVDALPADLARHIARVLPPNRITIVGERTDVHDWLGGVDIVALSSAWGEGFPNILGEAMAAGVPCVATDVGDSGWVVGEGGLTVQPGDADQMARAIVRLTAMDPAQRHRIGAIGRQRVIDNFTLEHVSNRYRRIYDTILAGPTSLPPESVAAAAVPEPRRT